MKLAITSIRASASRTFNHPTERYANFRHEITYVAELERSATISEILDASLALRRLAEDTAETHKRDILADIAQEQQRADLQKSLASARRWEERVAKYRARLSQFQEYRVPNWDMMLDSARDSLIRDVMEYDYWDGDYEKLRLVLEKRIAALEKNIEEETAEGPRLIDSIEQQLRDLPLLRLLPGSTEPEIHPGHPDHPDTAASNDEPW